MQTGKLPQTPSRRLTSDMLPWLLFATLVPAIVIAEISILSGRQTVPPAPPRYNDNPTTLDPSTRFAVAQAVAAWSVTDDGHPWELSGLYQGDIMRYDHRDDGDDDDEDERNGLRDTSARWKNATVPYFIDETQFSNEQVRTILRGIQEYNNKTCVRFRPYKINDENWIVIRGDSSGCWSSVGRKSRGQVVNLQVPGCVHHGVVVHELLHALGFYHQQSATERDQYVNINWENIRSGMEHNFNKYNDTFVTNYNTTYDYGSVMHYSEKAFSKNNKTTIDAKRPGITLGQRQGLSNTDIVKLNLMYNATCHPQAVSSEDGDEDDALMALITWFGNLTGL